MGGLTATLGAADTKLITIKMRARVPLVQPVPNDASEMSLLEFGNADINLPYQISGSPSAANSYTNSAAYNTKSGVFITNSNGSLHIFAQFSAASLGTTITDLTAGSNLGIRQGTWWSAANSSTTAPPLGEWFDLIVAYDGTNASTVPDTMLGVKPDWTLGYATSFQTLYIFINGVNVSGSYLDANSFIYPAPPDDSRPGQVLAALSSDSTSNTNLDGASYVPLTNVILPFARFTTDLEVSGPSTGLPYLNQAPNAVTLASSNIAVNGTEIGIPTMTANRTQSPKAESAGIQIWFGQFIDPTNPTSLAALSNADPTVAVAAFGTPYIDIRGPAAGVTTNNGSGPNFTQAGTISDFSPGP
jgi:hypothetical protein